MKLAKLAALCSAVFATLAFGAGGEIAHAQSVATVRVANLDLGTYVPINYIEKIAAKHNIALQMTTFRRGLEAAQAVKAGEADVGVGGIEAAISGVAGGSSVVIVGNMFSGGAAWVARPDSNIKTVADLKGRKLGVIRGFHELLARTVLEKYGLTASPEPGAADVQLVFLSGGAANNTALETGQIDASSNVEPYPSRAIVRGYGKLLLIPTNTALGSLPRCVFMSRDFIAKNPEVAQRFIDALVEATKTLRDNPKLAREFAVNDALKGQVSLDDWDLMFKNGDSEFDVNVSLPVIQAHADFMLKFGMIRQKLDAASFTNLSMLENAVKRYGW